MNPTQAEIPLYPGNPPAGEPEQWETGRSGDRIVRNVTWPTLTPILPNPASASGTGLIIAPGGGFRLLAIDGEGFDAAQWLADRGVATFVLKYRVASTPRDPAAFANLMASHRAANDNGQQGSGVPDYSQAREDVRAALALVRARADQWNLLPGRLGIMGFSAGAMATLDVAIGDGDSPRPDFIAPIYGPMAARPIPADAPPMFAMMAADDPFFAHAGFDLLAQYRLAGRPAEFHWYERGGHAFGLRQQGATSDLWIAQFLAWLSMRGLLIPAR